MSFLEIIDNLYEELYILCYNITYDRERFNDIENIETKTRIYFLTESLIKQIKVFNNDSIIYSSPTNYDTKKRFEMNDLEDGNRYLEDGNRGLLNYFAMFGYNDLIKLMIDNGADVNRCDCHGVSPYYEALLSGKIDTCKLLLEYGADISFLVKEYLHNPEDFLFNIDDEDNIREYFISEVKNFITFKLCKYLVYLI